MPISKTFQYGKHTVKLETGVVARQTTASVMITVGETVLLVTVVSSKTGDPSRGFFPLTVVYQEKTYAGGKIPGGFFKREGRPSESEVLTSRLIDRPIRPLFDKDFLHEVQVVATVMSADPEVSADIPAIIGVSAALAISGLPFAGPVGAARVGYRDGEYLLNPSVADLETSKLELMVAGTESAVLMVESEAKELTEEEMLKAVTFGHEQMQVVIKAIQEFADEAGVTEFAWTRPEHDAALYQSVKTQCESAIADAYDIADKMDRYSKLADIKTQAKESMQAQADESGDAEAYLRDVSGYFEKVQKSVVRDRVLNTGKRIDGRDTKTVRPISIEVDYLPRTHGSALFTRGETQAIVVVTMGTERDSQIIDGLLGESKDGFMLHYNFPPYCVGETGMMGSPKRREIGHGWLAKRAIRAVLPGMDNFPYALRVVSEITESNGSSSMASVCGTSLALMQAGVPIKGQVAGIAMGLVKEGEKFAVLTDILGDEDHLGDMDFKVAGTAEGITALQMDIKIDGITHEIMETALAQAKGNRLHILGEMNKVISAPRTDMSSHAPKIVTMKINPDKIRDVIGKGGATIRQITEETGVTMDITDDGTVKIYSADGAAAEAAVQRVKDCTDDVEIGKIYEGKVEKIMDFGAFVAVMPGKSGLVHISQIAEERVENVTDYLSEGQVVKVKVLEIDRQGRVRLSMKALTEDAEQPAAN